MECLKKMRVIDCLYLFGAILIVLPRFKMVKLILSNLKKIMRHLVVGSM